MRAIDRQAPAGLSCDRRLDLLEAQLADLMLHVADVRRRPQPHLGLLRAALVGIAAMVLAAAAPTGASVRAPFQVVDDAGKPLFTVTDIGDYGFFLHDAAGKRVVVGGVKLRNSYFKVQTPVKPSARSGKSTPAANGSAEAIIGQIGGTTPAVNLRTDDKTRISMAVADGKPALNMGNGAINVAQAESGGGLLQLGDPRGNEIVAFVVGKNGVGVVRAQPVGNVGANIPTTGIFRGTGLPTSMICGIGCSHP